MLKRFIVLPNNILRLYFHDGFRDFYLTKNSGKILGRPKQIVFTTVTHTGIELGVCCQTNQTAIIHNHPDKGYAHLVWFSEFAQNQPVTYQSEQCVNPPNVVISKGLNAVINQTPYRVVTSNCQTLTGDACDNKPKSSDADWYLGAAAIFGFLLFAGIGISSIK